MSDLTRHKARTLILGFPVALAITSSWAEASTGLAFLRVNPGARAVAMGEAVVSHAGDASAVFWNPGAIAIHPGTAVEMTHNESFQDVRHEFLAGARQWGRHGIGAAFNGTWADNIPGYDDTGQPTEAFGYYGLTLIGSYSLAINERTGAGVGVEYIREQLDAFDASGVAVNFGIQALDLVPRTDVGLAILHLGSPVKYERSEYDLPRTVQAGISHTIRLPIARSTVRLAAEVRSVRDETAQVLLGTEYRYEQTFSLEAGYRSGLDSQDVSVGFGIGGARLSAHYALVPFDEDLGDQQRLSIAARW